MDWTLKKIKNTKIQQNKKIQSNGVLKKIRKMKFNQMDMEQK